MANVPFDLFMLGSTSKFSFKFSFKILFLETQKMFSQKLKEFNSYVA